MCKSEGKGVGQNLLNKTFTKEEEEEEAAAVKKTGTQSMSGVAMLRNFLNDILLFPSKSDHILSQARKGARKIVLPSGSFVYSINNLSPTLSLLTNLFRQGVRRVVSVIHYFEEPGGVG